MGEQHRTIEYGALNDMAAEHFVALLNQQTTRQHLIDHEPFDADSIEDWINAKLDVDAQPGCRVRSVIVDGQLAGWCAIQQDSGQYEIALVLDHSYWGLGKTVLREILEWAQELGHTTLLIHFLHTRPDYPFLRRLSRRVYESEWMGDRFLSYELEVSRLASLSG